MPLYPESMEASFQHPPFWVGPLGAFPMGRLEVPLWPIHTLCLPLDPSLQWKGEHFPLMVGGFRDHSLKNAASLATLYQGLTVINHHWPPEPFLCESQCPLLTLMAHVMVDTIQGCMALTSRDYKGQDPFSLSLGWNLTHWKPGWKPA